MDPAQDFESSLDALPIKLDDSINGAGGGNRCAAKDKCERARVSSVTFDEYHDPGRVRGHFLLDFPDERVTGAFDAIWCKSEVPCG